jgi:hypothetical protein
LVVSAGGKNDTDPVRSFPLVCLLLWIWAGCAGAQLLPRELIPLRPANGLSDVYGVIARDTEAQQNITGLIRDLEIRYGYKLYVVLERKLILTTANSLASQLCEMWLPNGGGLVIVFELDTRKIGCGYRFGKSGEGMESDSEVPAYELEAILARAFADMKRSESMESNMESAVTLIGEGIHDYFDRKKVPPEEGRSLKLALIAVGALSLLALGGMLLGWLLGKSDRKQSKKRTFPLFDVPERLSAPYGGGGGGYGRFG